MSTTTEITSNAAAYLTGDLNAQLDLNGYDALSDDMDAEYDMAAANAEYRAFVEGLLEECRPTWTIAGNFIVAPVEDATPLTEDELTSIRDAIAEHHHSGRSGDLLQRHTR